MTFKTSYILLLLTAACLTSCHQNGITDSLITKYSFVPKNNNLTDTNYISSADKKLSFEITREIMLEGGSGKDSIFIDYPLICVSDEPYCGVKYKKMINGNWLVYGNKTWNPFFDKTLNKLKVAQMNEDSLFFIPLEKENITIANNENLYGFKAATLKVNFYEPENNNIFLFDPDFGVVAIKMPATDLVRSDFSEKLQSMRKQ